MMYDTFYNHSPVLFVYRMAKDQFVRGYNRLEVLIPYGTIVAFDPENLKMYYGSDILPFTSLEFIESTRTLKYEELLEKTKEEYFEMYNKELSEKAGFSNEIINYGNVDIRDGSVCSNLINKGIKFRITRMD